MDQKLKDKKLLVVGAGGIGCELLKNLVLTGFTKIEVIDLDTIELSNLNRQFLFHKQHVGKSKSETARDSVLKYANAQANGTEIVAHHDSVMNPKYSVEYFRQFELVLNALDNKTARSHVNRLCLASNVPLIESGSAGYLGQITLISRGRTECYDCLPKAPAKTFPGCTIRNTPSEPIHCIVWAKHLFNQLFGSEDPDEAVSPDGHDPENMAEAGQNALASLNTANSDEQEKERKSTRQWAKETSYDAVKLFNKLFNDDIKYLLSMSKLWEKRRPPTPLDYAECELSILVPGDKTSMAAASETTTTTTVSKSEEGSNSSKSTSSQADFEALKLWTLGECVRVFVESVKELSERLEHETLLHWDKDDECALKFVASAANLRSAIFGIPQKSKFEIKSLAGNIIPAIASTNAIVAGLIVIQAIKVLSSQLDACKTVYLRDKAIVNKLIVSTSLQKPNPKCYVCASKPELAVRLDLHKFTIKQLETKILKEELNMIQPDVEIDDGTGRIIISSEEGETEENNHKVLSFFGITDQTRLKCDDFFQNFELRIVLHHSERVDSSSDTNKDYEMISDWQTVKEIQEAVHKETQAEKEKNITAAQKINNDETNGENDVIVEESNSNENQTKELKTPFEQVSRPSPNAAQKRSFETAFANEENNVTKSMSDGGCKKNTNNNAHDNNDDFNGVSVVEVAAKKAKPSDITDNAGSHNSDVSSNSINDASDVISDLEENLKATEATHTSTRQQIIDSNGILTEVVATTTNSRQTNDSRNTHLEEQEEILIEEEENKTDDDDDDDDCIIEEFNEDYEEPSRKRDIVRFNEESNTASSTANAFVVVNPRPVSDIDQNKLNDVFQNSQKNSDKEDDEDDDIIECTSDNESNSNRKNVINSVITSTHRIEPEDSNFDDVIEINDDN